MQGYIGYIRVSTVKQGTQGVSLSEQRDAISRYAAQNRYSVDLWLDEWETAAKKGRPVFNQALKLLRQKKYKGIIVHKLDRGSRNLKDWYDIGELSDAGIEIHFVSEKLDLQSRGGRLAADIQAVVAADYIRNLRDETKKGLYGRLKQGLYPWQAPIGYLDQGGGKPKTIDEIKGPMIRRAFELYATGNHSLDALAEAMYQYGLRNHNGGRVTCNGFSTIFNNPFYIGIIRIKKTKETFAGVHKPLISKRLFDQVQKVRTGKVRTKIQRNAFQFRMLFSCITCGYSLVGERHKGHVYYRCHGKHFPRTSIREEIITHQVEQVLRSLCFNPREKECIRPKLLALGQDSSQSRETELKAIKLQLAQIKERHDRLVDAYLDKSLDKDSFEKRKEGLLLEQRTAEEKLLNLSNPRGLQSDGITKLLELAGSAWLSYQSGNAEEKRNMLKIISSNRTAIGKQLYFEPSIPFGILANRSINQSCDPERGVVRTCNKILKELAALNDRGELPDLSSIPDFAHPGEEADRDDDDQDDCMDLAA